VTGGTGFVGSNLIRKLISSKHELHSINKNPNNFWRISDVKDRINIHNVDLSDQKKLEKTIKKINPEIVFHLASYGVDPSEKNFSKNIQTNLIGTYNLFSTLSDHKIKKIINVGSVFEYGFPINNQGFSEKDCMNPLTLYGILKSVQTNLADYFFNSKSLPVTTLRLFTPYGMFEKKGRLVSDIMVALIKKKKLKISSPKPTRDFIFIDDVITALIKTSVAKNVNGKIFNIGLGKSTSVEQILDISKNLSNFELKTQTTKIHRRDYDLLGGKGHAKISQAKKFLNWSPKYSIEEGLEKTFLWYKNNISLYS